MGRPAGTSADKEWSVFAAPVNAVLLAGEQHGVKRSLLLAAVGLSEAALAAPDSRVSVKTYLDLARRAVAAVEDPDLALLSGRISFLSGLNLQIYMTTICHTFRDYLNLMPSVLKLWGDIGEVKISADGDFIRLEWHPLDPETGRDRFLSDSMLYASSLIVDSLCLLPVPVLKARFTYAEPADKIALRRAFGNDLGFDAPISCLYFARESLGYPLAKQNYRAGPGAAIPFSDLFDGKDPSDKFWARLRQAIVQRLPLGELSQGDVAADMNLSVRSLQRQLAERGTQFRQEVRAIREQLARRYLADQAVSITEAAFLLGYGDQSAFSTAFKGWTGQAPSEYQERNRTGVK